MRLLSEDASAKAEEPEVGGAPLPSASVGEARIPGATLDEEGRARELEGTTDSRGPIAHGGKPVAVGPAVDEQKPPRPIDDPSGKALDKFFAKLAAVETKQPNAIARVLYYGESIVASDFVTGVACVESNDGIDRAAQDVVAPSPGQVFYYLVRPRSGCPNGGGSLGSNSYGVPRTAGSCQ